MAAAASAPPVPSMGDGALDHDDSNMSSPLSDVDDEKEPEPDDPNAMALDTVPIRDDASDSESNLSDANDTEAETERLYDTPPNNRQKDVVVDKYNIGDVFEHTPSKLKQSAVVDDEADHPDDDDDDDLSDDELSLPSSPADEDESPSKPAKSIEPPSRTDNAKAVADRKKRKRSLLPDPSDVEQPLRKRTGSVGPAEGEHTEDDAIMAEDEPLSTNTNSGEHSVVGDVADAEPDKDHLSLDDDTASNEPLMAKKLTRNGSKRQPEASGTRINDDADAELQDDVRDGATEEEAEPHVEEEELEADAEEDPEAAAKNDEELAKKRLALEDWTEIEGKFSVFRDRLYKDRLEKLEQEEQTLLGDEPTHEVYLNMRQCLDNRLSDTMKQIDREFALQIQGNERLAVARRAELWDNFYQHVREDRENVLDDLNEEWYAIQMRRRNAHSLQDFGIFFPTTAAQRTRNAVAYNTEVSILSGIAKYRGFPAVPPLREVSAQELEDDLEAMKRGRRRRQNSLLQPIEDHTLLGPAGQQFIKDTPWANPNHASHKHHQPSLAHKEGARTGSPMVGSKPAHHSPLSAIPNGQPGPLAGSRATPASPELTRTPLVTSAKPKKASSLASGAGKAKAIPDPPKPDSAIAMVS